MAYYDATHPSARAALWQRLNGNYRSLGVSCSWLDACEPDLPREVADRAVYAAGPAAEVANLYPLLHTRAVAEGLRTVGEDRSLSLTGPRVRAAGVTGPCCGPATSPPPSTPSRARSGPG
jgi:alpha-D-xyloside xylohydrolase